MDELYLQAKQLPFLISWGIWVNPLALFLQLSKLIQISYLVKYWLRVSERPFARVLKRHFPRVLKRPPSLFKLLVSQQLSSKGLIRVSEIITCFTNFQFPPEMTARPFCFSESLPILTWCFSVLGGIHPITFFMDPGHHPYKYHLLSEICAYKSWMYPPPSNSGK